MNWKVWLKGLGMAVAGGVVGSVTPAVGNWAAGMITNAQNGPLTGGSIGGAALGTAIISTIAYLMKRPQDTTAPTEKK